jgi:hypothetical protein
VERYDSVAALADDLRRYLGNEPISVRPDSLSYRAAKFVPRHNFDRIFCLRRGSEVAQERGDSQQGIARMQAVWEMVKRSPFDSDSLELQPLMELAEAYRVGGQSLWPIPHSSARPR